MEHLKITIFIFTCVSFATCHPSASSFSPHPVQNNQLTVDESSLNDSLEAPTGGSDFVFPVEEPKIDPQFDIAQYQRFSHEPTPIRQSDSSPSSTVGLSTNGDITVSAYFSKFFWVILDTFIGAAAIFFLIRFIYPHSSLQDLPVKKTHSGKTGKNLNLDGITDLVYGALDYYNDKFFVAKNVSVITDNKI